MSEAKIIPLDARELWQAHVKEGLRRSQKCLGGLLHRGAVPLSRLVNETGLAVLFGLLGQAKPRLSHFHQGQSVG